MTQFYTQQKRVGRGLNSGETERERERGGERDSVAAEGLQHGIFMTARERIVLDLIKMNI
jgi:hypothetical protein